MQKNWIGKSSGCEINFEVENLKKIITVFTTRPDTIFGATFTAGYEIDEVSTVINTADTLDATGALNYSVGNFALGFQKKVHEEGTTTTGAQEVRYNDTAMGISYAVNDSLSVSYNRYESKRHNPGAVNVEQTTTAFNIGYTMGGMTIGFQEASTDNAAWVLDGEDDSTTLGISVAF